MLSIGSWMQIGNSEIAEIMGDSNFEWVAVDMEHGSITYSQLPDIFRALELNGTKPYVRVGSSADVLRVLEAGAKGIIIPNIETSIQLSNVKDLIANRGVGFNRANGYGKHFDKHLNSFPQVIAMIESMTAVDNLSTILSEGCDAVLIGPYDLSASLGKSGDFENPDYLDALNTIMSACKYYKVPNGIHVVYPSVEKLNQRIKEGYEFIAYGVDTTFLREGVDNL